MKTFSKLNESAKTTDTQPGNDLAKTGITNHYTPIENILTNVKNLFALKLGVVAAIGEDNVSLKLHSSKFVDDKSINSVLFEPVDRFTNLYSYITSQGLNKMTKVDLGQYTVLYFSPTDVKTAQDPQKMVNVPTTVVATESFENEIVNMIKEDDSEEEMKDVTLEKFLELIELKDKVKAAKQLELLVSQQIELPREFYFAAVKFKTGEEAIALRWKYTKKLPTGQSTESVRSIMHIFGKGDKAIWVQDYAKESIVQLPDEVKKLIDNILEMIDAEKTDDPAIFKLTGERKEREDKKDKDKDENDENNDNKDDDAKEKKSEDDDDEDDNSRGDDTDNA